MLMVIGLCGIGRDVGVRCGRQRTARMDRHTYRAIERVEVVGASGERETFHAAGHAGPPIGAAAGKIVGGIVLQMATLAERGEVRRCVVEGIVVEVAASQHHKRPSQS